MKRNFHTLRLTLAGSLGLLLLVMLVFSGVLKHLPGRKSHHVVVAAVDLVDAPSAASSRQPLRYKRPMLTKHRTPVHLQHLRGKMVRLCSVVAIAKLELRSLLPADPYLAAHNAGRRTTGARAPPLA